MLDVRLGCPNDDIYVEFDVSTGEPPSRVVGRETYGVISRFVRRECETTFMGTTSLHYNVIRSHFLDIDLDS